MKKLFVCLLALTLTLMMLASCGDKETTNENTDETTVAANETVTEKNNEETAEKLINDDGEEFIVDTTTKGSIKEGAASINEAKITLCGKEYAFPVKISDLIADGWYFSENQDVSEKVPAESVAMTNGIYLFSADGSEITIGEICNELTEEAGIEDCLITRVSLDVEWEDITDFVLPGGIIADSTAADVLSVFGNPNEAEGFESGYNLDDQLSYENNEESGLTYHFTFNEDGTLYSCSVESEN